MCNHNRSASRVVPVFTVSPVQTAVCFSLAELKKKNTNLIINKYACSWNVEWMLCCGTFPDDVRIYRKETTTKKKEEEGQIYIYIYLDL
eukprot:gene9438-6621_t